MTYPINQWRKISREDRAAICFVIKKITSLEEIDNKIVGPVLEHLQASGEEFRILVTPDHPTYLSTKTHTHGNVPFTICGTGISADQFENYNESNAEASQIEMLNGWELMPFFLK